ncbi:MAG TPA: ABC transporter substrate-binding protein [Solirubrobacteraceae bacterium]|nr:ABC transporter substrate-binding protein [Solirubrobacteraceae bacterium]
MEHEGESFQASDAADAGVTSEMTRRRLLAGAAQVGVTLTGAGLLAACGGSSSGGSTSSASNNTPAGALTALPGGTPKRGGTFTVGVISGGQSENIFPGTPVGTPDYVRDYNLYNLLFYPGEKISPIVPGLALSAEPNADATLWTFKLRDGVTWHDGKPFTADDVVWNFKSLWSNPAANFASGFLAGLVSFRDVRKRDRLTVEVPLAMPVAEFPTIFAYYDFGVVQNGATPKSVAKHPIGTGPFRYVSFTPGSHSVFERNPDYWESGKPYVDRLVVDSSFTDNTSIFNALLSGSINLFPTPPLVTARQQLNAKQVQILASPFAAESYMFAMRVDSGQFADNRIREAFKTLVDRQALIDGAWAGFGSPAYDLLAPGTEYYASDLVRKRDVEKARHLFKSAGVLGQTFQLPTTDFLPGMVESSTLLAEQATAAGIKVVVTTKNAATYFTPAGGFTVRDFGYEVDQPVCSLTSAYLSEYTLSCPYPDTHWGKQSGGAAAEKLISQAMGATDKSKAASLWRECQLQQFNQGGYLVWGNLPYVDAAASNVRGLRAGAGFSYNNWRLLDGWID